MSLQVHSPTPSSPSMSPQDLPRPSSRSERLLRETLRRDRALSLSPRTRVRRSDSHSARMPSTSGEMFHCACTGEDDEDDADDTPAVSLLFAPQRSPKQPRSPPPLQRASKSTTDVPRGRERYTEKDDAAPLPSPTGSAGSSRPHGSSRAPLQNQLENMLRGPNAQAREGPHPDADREWAWSSPESSLQSSSMSSPTSPNPQPLTPSPSPPSYSALPSHCQQPTMSPALSRAPSSRGRARHHTHPQAGPPPPPLPKSALLTPPPTPPTFDAQSAAAKLRDMNGYVSFANVEGLGPPPGQDLDAEAEREAEEAKRRAWWPFGRGRSGSLTAQS